MCVTSAISSIRLSASSGLKSLGWTFGFGAVLWILVRAVRAVSNEKWMVAVGITGVREDTGFVGRWSAG